MSGWPVNLRAVFAWLASSRRVIAGFALVAMLVAVICVGLSHADAGHTMVSASSIAWGKE
jgi:hypothetical protein